MATSNSTMATPLTVKEFNNPLENAISFPRENGDTVNFALQHFATVREFDVVVIDPETEEPRELVTLSYAEVRLLKAHLNSAAVSALLDAAE